MDKIENMRKLTISVSELEYEKYDLKSDDLSFSELVDLISRELSRQNLKKTVDLSEQYGMSKVTIEDITKEIKRLQNNYS